jgi:arylsulfatase A-like enzyme
MKQTIPLITLAALLLTPLLSHAADATKVEPASKPPNVIVILADDQGYADLSIQHQVPDIKTPNIDALAAQGVRMTAGYVTAPQCSPSRAGLISGRYQQKFGLDSIADDPMPLEERTIPKRLKEAGYVSCQVGKWHLDPNATSVKWARKNFPELIPGKDGRVAIPGQSIRQFSPLAQGFDECFEGEEHKYFATYDCDGKTLDPHGTMINQPGYRLETQTAAALAFLKRHHDQPFFLYLAYYGPHVPLEATEKYLSRFPGPMAERRRTALAMLSAIDDGVGQLTAALKEYGISDNTLIVFTSDNGAPLGAHNGQPMADVLPVNKSGAIWDGSLNTPWVGEKGMLAEGGIRMPFIMSWPGRLPAGKVYDQPVSTLDIAATAVALAGIPSDDRLDGVNLIPHLTGEDQKPPHESLYWRFQDQAAVRSGKWKYIQAGSEANYLFDVTSDEHEKHNLITEHPEIARDLKAKLSDWTSRLAPPGDPDHLLNAQEKKWYQYYFGLTD